MFNKLAAISSLAVLAVATPAPNAVPASSCDTGALQCCDSTSSTVTPAISKLFGLLGISAQGVAIPIGLTCSPISVVGVGGNSCTAAPVCCSNNSFKGVVALGCIPVDLSL